ncbi:heparan-alpha-glucosaminide N-acetyltransferase domain-containing protein [Kocuria rosea]|uniref:DUF1624 domain-containing protein n=1 Tax=Kocuria rosea TaxID=1275 RepID=A0A4R5YLX6_KOCRO|nr:heparan-alpha-glucosaminide N-acetyltransferase domain-containing protein [Kocuria rosea]TDL46535.1 DUF1624 domain-containing protein [Kocuria rosea]
MTTSQGRDAARSASGTQGAAPGDPHTKPETPTETTTPGGTPPGKRRLVGIDAARGLALIGMISIHILPSWDPETFEPTAQWTVFAGRSVALFALLAGVGLAFSTGGRTPHTGRVLTADRAGVVVRALLIATLGLAINQVIPGNTIAEVPAVNILVYYGAFFVLTIPFLGISAPALFAWAGFFAVAGPVLVHVVRDVLPAAAGSNPGLTDLVTDPGTTSAQLLLTGTYPALPYLAYLLAGMGIGRLNLAGVQTQVCLLVFGIGLAVAAWCAYWVLILQTGGYDQLLTHTPALGEDGIDEIIVWGPDPVLPTSTWWWLAIAGPYTNTPLALATGAGSGAAALGGCLLLARRFGTWLLPLSAMGAMTLSLYSAHLLALSTEVHYDQPVWFLVHVGAALVFALCWRRAMGQGPLERLVAAAVGATRRAVLPRTRTT